MRTSIRDKWSAKKAKQLVKESGFRRSFIAEKIGISAVTLSQILNGRSPSPQTAMLLAQAIGKSVEDFFLNSAKKAS